MQGPKEDPEDKRDRERARRSAELERRKSAQANARGLTADLGAVYGFSGLPGFGTVGSAAAAPGRSGPLAGLFKGGFK